MPTLERVPALAATGLVAVSVAEALAVLPSDVLTRIEAAPIDPDLADTAAFSDAYGFPLEGGANCIVVAGKRGDEVRYAACVVLASTKLDVNRVVKKLLDVRKASFAPMDAAVALTGMEYGGITLIGLPASWPVYVDERVLRAPDVVIGAGRRGAKLFLPGAVLGALPTVTVVDGLATEPEPLS
ncbi:prolyl-tRNA editing enzyme YbaK/EbsC (Cys-tRNA(Pro) deacylase) [Curtobacterium flaccumfaciens]|uniref:Prolyl-tRNA editing enzyme YbaK/EbsC (Cys-tRNA(Pro) deacylase) n=1 Tax=Curtobacterium flaccumfaciens TaxID=2035 RepID=A0A4V3BKP8_9MICO|nr:YbaK/EbsC family protein [Curtobacterium flaccumfaciens]TDN43682.1 prolyl-tRNA editing enzyme YbaK/EbsC (Cys-tRNA(Pro) deacylase) [Curtobacterium flaccumfaciens]